jgi:murein DD-endopeptidase MepM/ murein hydrolase activator NlpD
VGALVITAGAGRVLSAADDGPYGNKLVIDHGGGVRTIYAQLSRFNVREGDCVEAGQVVAAVGNTGLSSGPHLHYETHVEGKVVDPMTVQLGNSVNR